MRTYHWPRGQVTDHRLGSERFVLDDVLGGDLWWILQALRRKEIREQLAEILG